MSVFEIKIDVRGDRNIQLKKLKCVLFMIYVAEIIVRYRVSFTV